MNDNELLKKFGEVLDQKLEPINKRLGNLERGQRKQGKDITHIRKTVDVLVKWTDEADVDLQHRMSRVEKVLDLPPLEHQKH